MGKISQLSSRFLGILSVILLMSVFVTLSMSFTPTEEEEVVVVNENGSTTTTKRYAHSEGCMGVGATTTDDYGKATAITLGNGKVTVESAKASDETSVVVPDKYGYKDGNNTSNNLSAAQSSGSNPNDYSSLQWKCNETDKTKGTESAHKHTVKFTATPEPGYKVDGWSTDGKTVSPGMESNTIIYQMVMSQDEYNTSSGQTLSYTLYAHFSVKKNATITLYATGGGSFTYTDGKSINGEINSTNREQGIQVLTADEITYTAQAESGFQFYRWKIESSNATNYSYNTLFEKAYDTDVTITAEFISSSYPIFMIEETGRQFWDLNEAISACGANKWMIVLIKDGTLPAGTYTIPQNVKLLIPFNSQHSIYEEWPEDAGPNIGGWKNPPKMSAYSVLTMANDAHLIIDGQLNLSAKIGRGQPYSGFPYPKYGQIIMQEGSTITVNNKGKLFCWGYITDDITGGGGYITAKNGSYVYEFFQLSCWRGGRAALNMASTNRIMQVFPFSQYYVQNIEVKLELEAGANEKLYTGANDVTGSPTPLASATYIGSNDGLFRITSGSMTKWYDPKNDRQVYQFDGNISLASVIIEFNVKVNSKDFVLPINSNMDLIVSSGTLTCNQMVALLPGATITVKKGANLDLGKDSEIYVYDKDDWGNYAYANEQLIPVAYSPTCSNVYSLRNKDNLSDAIVDINGLVTTSSGHVYTTMGKADICSTEGTGQIQYLAKAGDNKQTYQGTQSNTDITYVSIPIEPAQLHNEDNSYTSTKDVSNPDMIEYKNGHWGWRVIWLNKDGDVIKSENYYKQPSNDWIEQKKPNAENNYSDDCAEYVFAGWKENINTDYQEITYEPIFERNTFTYTISYNKGQFGKGTIEPDIKECNKDITLSSAVFTREDDDCCFYSQTGWTTTNDDGGEKEYELGAIYQEDKALTLYPYWTKTEILGDPLDIIDWTSNSISINTTGYVAPTKPGAYWQIVVGDNVKGWYLGTDDRNPDLTIDIDGLNLVPDKELVILTQTIIDNEITVDGRQKYVIPHIYNGGMLTKNTGFNEKSWLFVRSGQLIIDCELTVKQVVVCPGAELVIAESGKLTVTDQLRLRTKAFESAILTNNGELNVNRQMYYSRISTTNAHAYPFGLPFKTDLNNTIFSNGKKAIHGSHYAIMVYDSQGRANQGMGGNWNRLGPTDADQGVTMTNANQGYQFLSGSKYYYEVMFPVAYSVVNNDASVEVYAYKSQDPEKFSDTGSEGWNYICQPYTHIYKSEISKPEEELKISLQNKDDLNYFDQVTISELTEDEDKRGLLPTLPFYYQAKEDGSLTFSEQFSLASRSVISRYIANDVQTQWLRLEYGNEQSTDRTNIYINQNKFTTKYEIGYDVNKMTTSGDHTLIYTSLPYGNLAFAAVPDSVAEEGIELTVNNPEDGRMMFTLKDNDFLSRIEAVYLTDRLTHNTIDLMRYNYLYVAKKGLCTGRFVLNVVMYEDSEEGNKGTATDIDKTNVEAGTDAMPVKIFQNNNFYILMPDGTKYSILGSEVK